jgi:hypothetical protein
MLNNDINENFVYFDGFDYADIPIATNPLAFTIYRRRETIFPVILPLIYKHRNCNGTDRQSSHVDE